MWGLAVGIESFSKNKWGLEKQSERRNRYAGSSKNSKNEIMIKIG